MVGFMRVFSVLSIPNRTFGSTKIMHKLTAHFVRSTSDTKKTMNYEIASRRQECKTQTKTLTPFNAYIVPHSLYTAVPGLISHPLSAYLAARYPPPSIVQSRYSFSPPPATSHTKPQYPSWECTRRTTINWHARQGWSRL